MAGARRNNGEAKMIQLATTPGMQVIFGGLESGPCAAPKIDGPLATKESPASTARSLGRGRL